MRNKLTRALVLFAVVAVALGAIVQVTRAQGPGLVIVSTAKPGQTQDGVSYGREDLLAQWDGGWYKIFDGSDYGLDGKRHNVNAFGFPWYGVGDPGDISGTLPFGMMSFSAPQVSVPDIPVKVTAQDIVVFENYDRASGDGSFYLIFDGSDVGLNLASERIDGLSWYPYEGEPRAASDYITHDCSEGIFFISTVGNYVVPMANGSEGPITWLKGSGSDILLFCATEIGYNTAGYWYKVFDSFDAGVTPRNAIDSISVWDFENGIEGDSFGMIFSFATKSRFSAPGVGGDPSDLIFSETYYSPTVGTEAMFENFGGVNDFYPRLNGKVDAGEFFPYLR